MPWQPGQSGNPKGRKPGARIASAEHVIKEFTEHLKEHGRVAIERVWKDKPDVYLGLGARFVLANIELEVIDSRRSISEFSTSELVQLLERESPPEIDATPQLVESETT